MLSRKLIPADEFVWLSPDKRPSRFPGIMASGNPEPRAPTLWLSRRGDELYLVNSSSEALDLVRVETAGWLSADDVPVPLTTTPFEYHSVAPGTAAKIDEYDLYDHDFVLQVCILIQSESLGSVELRTRPRKGGAQEAVLRWETGEWAEDVTVKR